jgi:polysaccharide export outer membrane protein
LPRMRWLHASGLALLVAASALASAHAGDAGSGATLLAVRRGPQPGSFRLICPGLTGHGLAAEDAGRLVIVTLPGSGSAVEPEDLPAPEGIVRSIGLGAGSEGVRVVFALSVPAAATSEVDGQGLVLRLEGLSGERATAGGANSILGPEDLLEINVFDVDELNRTVRVSESGTVSLPLIGDVMAGGLTPRQFQDRIRERLGDLFLHDPQVSIFVREHGSKRVSVLGAVGRPGVYEMVGPRKLLQVLAQAGGLGPEAADELYVIRAASGGEGARLAIRVDDLVMSRDPELNVPVLPGDVISVPSDPMVHVYVDGAVGEPGRIEQPARRPITLLQAIAKAGGATERANLKKVTILRQAEDGTQGSMEVNMARIRKGKDVDPLLRDGDMVVVHETFF